MPTCVVSNCRNTYPDGSRMFRCPKNENVIDIWRNAMGSLGPSDWNAAKNYRICEAHFETSDFRGYGLKEDAVPSIFQPSNRFKASTQQRFRLGDMLIDHPYAMHPLEKEARSARIPKKHPEPPSRFRERREVLRGCRVVRRSFSLAAPEDFPQVGERQSDDDDSSPPTAESPRTPTRPPHDSDAVGALFRPRAPKHSCALTPQSPNSCPSGFSDTKTRIRGDLATGQRIPKPAQTTSKFGGKKTAQRPANAVNMCSLCSCACSLIRWVFCLASVALIVVAFVVGGYVLGPLVVKDKDKAPSVYEYYTAGGVVEGLKAGEVDFTLNKKVISLHSGSIHYFRVHPQYWRDRLRKLRAAGFVAVETYVPWNLHEPYDGVFDFGNGGEDMSPFLDISTFLKIAKEEDLLAILRPGPYICAEWEFGGLPSWLLKDPSIRVRTSDPKYTERVQKYFDVLLPILKNHQFSTGQGPIIAFQVENEYGNTKEPNKETDKQHLRDIKLMFENAGLQELFFTSDTPSKGREYGAIEGVLEVANFNENATAELKILKELQPNKAAMVMEFWTGWFDHWGEAHHGMTLENFNKVLENILKYPSGVNFYMFHGGTSFGFLNGGNVYKEFPFYLPDISSYDYDAPLSEAGDYTDKYKATVDLLAKYQKVTFRIPERPVETTKIVYESLSSPDFLDWNTLLNQVEDEDKHSSAQPIYMENHPANGGSGQNFGYIVYRKNAQVLTPTSILKIEGKINGAAMVMVNNELKSPPLQTIDDLKGFGYWCSDSDKNTLDLKVSSTTTTVLDIIIENWSRNNYGKLSTDFNQVRGLTSDQVFVDGSKVRDFTIYALQFKGKWVRGLKNWTQNQVAGKGPAMLKFKLNVTEPADTFLDMQGWGKGVVFINGFNIGRYSALGPVRTLFAPAPLFKSGQNEICVFEHFKPSSELKFSDKTIFKDSEKTINVDL